MQFRPEFPKSTEILFWNLTQRRILRRSSRKYIWCSETEKKCSVPVLTFWPKPDFFYFRVYHILMERLKILKKFTLEEEFAGNSPVHSVDSTLTKLRSYLVAFKIIGEPRFLVNRQQFSKTDEMWLWLKEFGFLFTFFLQKSPNSVSLKIFDWNLSQSRILTRWTRKYIRIRSPKMTKKVSDGLLFWLKPDLFLFHAHHVLTNGPKIPNNSDP
jgi:hypothetical protein